MNRTFNLQNYYLYSLNSINGPNYYHPIENEKYLKEELDNGNNPLVLRPKDIHSLVLWTGSCTKIEKESFFTKTDLEEKLCKPLKALKITPFIRFIYILPHSDPLNSVEKETFIYEDFKFIFLIIPARFLLLPNNIFTYLKSKPLALTDTIIAGPQLSWKIMKHLLFKEKIKLTGGSNNKKEILSTNQYKLSIILALLTRTTLRENSSSFTGASSDKKIIIPEDELQNFQDNYYFELIQFLKNNNKKLKYSDLSEEQLEIIEKSLIEKKTWSSKDLDLDLELELRKRGKTEFILKFIESSFKI